jgi:hypothetical protein
MNAWWIANGALAAVSCVVNIWSAQGAPAPIKLSRLATAALALVYASGITWGLTTDQIAHWADLGRTVGPVAFLVVWIWPAVASRRARQQIVTRIEGVELGQLDSSPDPSALGRATDGPRPRGVVAA